MEPAAMERNMENNHGKRQVCSEYPEVISADPPGEDLCVCTSCGYREPYVKGFLCMSLKCVKCGSPMRRQRKCSKGK